MNLKPPERRWQKRMFWLLGTLTVASLALLVMLQGYRVPLGQSKYRYSSELAADQYFRSLGAPLGSSRPIDFRHTQQDGMVGDYASGSYRVVLPGKDVVDFYHRACHRAGLTSPASAETLIYYPEALCSGAAIVTVTPGCGGGKCTVFVEVTR
ncbi:MAG: hypothetical protein EOP66_00405 [Sphingomonas sp.]|nr:MAG: hypothetical protein EOP66_00405 [Sphingomonas sp.]